MQLKKWPIDNLIEKAIDRKKAQLFLAGVGPTGDQLLKKMTIGFDGVYQLEGGSFSTGPGRCLQPLYCDQNISDLKYYLGKVCSRLMQTNWQVFKALPDY